MKGLDMRIISLMLVAAGVLISTSNVAMAEGIDLGIITGAFKAADVTIAVLSVAGVLASIYATMTAAKMALRWIRGG